MTSPTRQNRIIRTYMSMAQVWAKLSRAKRKQVGCLIVKDSAIISDGFNGTPAGFDNTCEKDDGKTKDEVLHAELNAIAKLAKGTQSSLDSTMYITLAPCTQCAKLIIQAGISKVYYCEEYAEDGINLLRKADIRVERVQTQP